jgi:hypothetical protein
MATILQLITTAMQLYFTEDSFHNAEVLKLQGVKKNHVGVYKQNKKYVTLMQSYLEKIQPKIDIHGGQTRYL